MKDINQTVKMLKALANPVRLKVVRRLAASPEGKSGSELSSGIYLSQPTMSHHFNKLIEVGVITESKHGTQKTYMLNSADLQKHGFNPKKV